MATTMSTGAKVILGGIVTGGIVIGVVGWTASGSPNSQPVTQAVAAPSAQAPAATKTAENISTTALPDANYATPALLEARKRGLAAESAGSAEPAKTGTIEPIAIDPYTRAEYPDVVRQWGKLVPTINHERKVAAQIAARDARCDGVVNAQITDHGSRSNRHYMTECNNLTRIYFDGPSLAARRPALVRTQADMGAQGVHDW